MTKKQKKISDKENNFDWVGGVTEYDYLHIAHSPQGPYELDNGFDKIYNFDILKKLVPDYQTKFEKEIQKEINENDLNKINKGLKAYVESSTKQTDDLKILKASILSAYDGILCNLFEKQNEATQQFYGKDYFEKVDELVKINKRLLISPDSIIKYRKLATKYTINCIVEFHKRKYDKNYDLNFDEEEFNFFEVYRGLGNYRYYSNKKEKNFADMMSKFTAIQEPLVYIERQLLNSFSLSERVAEKFMTQKNNQRRIKLTTYFKIAVSNLFSSFIVNKSFNIEQYELLCLPMEKENYIFELVNDKISAEYFINDKPIFPQRLNRKEIK